MKALSVDQNKKLEICEIPMPKYTPCQALVRTVSCGVCNGTDSKLIHGTFKNMENYPMLLGHEAVGEVVEIGSKATSLKVGDKVLLPFLYEGVNNYTPGWGAFAEYGVVGDADAFIQNGMGPGTPQFDDSYYAQTIIKPTDKVTGTSAAMVITFREVLSAIRRFGFKPNQNVVIFGAGPVGLCFTRFSKLLGMGTVVTIDIAEDKMQEALAMGADVALNSTKTDVVKQVREIFPNGVDYVVDAVGMNSLINQAMHMVAYNGKICGYGISPKTGMDLQWGDAPYNWQLHFVQFPLKKEEAEAHNQIMAWINAGVLKAEDFISHVMPFKDIISAFDLVEQRVPSLKKIVITY